MEHKPFTLWIQKHNFSSQWSMPNFKSAQNWCRQVCMSANRYQSAFYSNDVHLSTTKRWNMPNDLQFLAKFGCFKNFSDSPSQSHLLSMSFCHHSHSTVQHFLCFLLKQLGRVLKQCMSNRIEILTFCWARSVPNWFSKFEKETITLSYNRSYSVKY